MTGGAGDAVGIALVYPDLLGTYGDSGNATVLAERLRWRGLAAEVVTVSGGQAVPEAADLYVVGGGEDLPQSLAAAALGRSGPLHRAVDRGATVFAVCAGLQILGTSFVGPDGVEADGIGLVDCRTVRGSGPRAVGELVVDPDPATGLPVLTGYENHGGVTRLGPDLHPLGAVRVGVGNGPGTGIGSARRSGPVARVGRRRGPVPGGSGRPTDGFVQGRVLGTYLHGPALARNPALADLLLRWTVGDLPPLPDPAVDDEAAALRAERLAAAPTQAAPSAVGRAPAPRRWARR